MAEIQDIKRFPSAKKLIAYAGLDPTVYESGKYKGQSKISKRGNRHLRRIVWIISVNLIRHNRVFKEYFLRKREKLPYKKAVLAVAHKFLRIAYSLLIKRQFFIPEYHILNPSKKILGKNFYAYKFS
jgi:transposase